MSTFFSFTSNQILSWKKSFGVHNLDAFVAHESTFYKSSDNYGQKSKIVRPNNTEWSNAVIMDYMDSQTYGFDMESYFGQIRYDYNDKYFFHGTLRLMVHHVLPKGRNGEHSVLSAPPGPSLTKIS